MRVKGAPAELEARRRLAAVLLGQGKGFNEVARLRVLAEDDHMLRRMSSAQADGHLARTFLAHGWDSPQSDTALQYADEYRFRGGP